MIKVLLCRFHKCLGPFSMLTVEGCSEMALFRESSNKVFYSPYFGRYISYDNLFFFWKCLKLDQDSINGRKNSEKFFRFYDNCIWIGKRKFPQSGTPYLLSSVNVLTHTPKISNFNKGDIFKFISSQSEENIDEGALMQISQMFGTL